MFKAMIIDDEPLVRLALRSSVDWNGLGFEIVGEHGDGQAALESAKNLMPDLLFTDIEMPGINGLEVIRRFKQLNPNIEVVILSSFGKFEYAQQAISLGVCYYILKLNIDINELTSILKEISGRLKENISAKKTDSDNQSLLQMLLEGKANNTASKVSIPEPPYFIALLSIDNYVFMPPGERLEYNPYSLNSLYRFIASSMNQECFLDCKYLYNGFFAVLLCRTCPEQIKSMLEPLLKSICDFYNLSLSASITGEIQSLEECKTWLYNPRMLAQKKFYLHPNCVVLHDECTVNPAGIDSKQIKQQICLALEQGVEQDVADTLQSFFSKCREHLITPANVRDIAIFFIFSIRDCFFKALDIDEETTESTMVNLINSVDFLSDVESIVFNICKNIFEFVRIENKNSKDAVLQVKTMIREHYMQQVTLTDMAASAHITPSYLSRIFKEEVGTGPIEYLTSYRIERAKDIMRQNRNILLYEIGDMVGYDNFSYFARVFKKHVGLTPKQYRSRFKKGE